MEIAGPRKEIRRRFIEGEGWMVEEVEIGAPLQGTQSVVPVSIQPPPVRAALVVADVPLALAREVIEVNGLIAVPLDFLNEEQLAELKIAPPISEKPKEPESPAPKKLTEAQAIKAVKAAADFDELNELTRNETRTAVLNAAEARAAELKG